MAVGVIVIAALYFGRDVRSAAGTGHPPELCAGPPVLLLRRAHFGRVPSVVASVLFAFW
jgi:hypothetical protein